jgi:hypothetical protein
MLFSPLGHAAHQSTLEDRIGNYLRNSLPVTAEPGLDPLTLRYGAALPDLAPADPVQIETVWGMRSGQERGIDAVH